MKNSFSRTGVVWLMLGLSGGLSGCANYFMRKSCNAINWYQHGFDLAMKGQRPSNDETLNNCRKAEAEISESKLDQGFKAGMAQYCRPEIVFQTGKKGENFNLDLCDPGQGRQLLAEHRKGVKEFCQADNGFAVGSSGRTYNKICPPDLEKSFLKEFNRGRKKYLQNMIAENASRTQDLDREISNSDQELRNLQYRLAVTPGPTKVIQSNTDAQGFTTTSTSTDDRYASERRNLESNISSKNHEIKSLREKQNDLRSKTYEYQRELSTLD